MTRLPAQQRREQLLDVAADLFASRGYARTTTAELAKAAGVTEPIIYRHFQTKRDLFVALIERTGHETLEQWERDLAGASDPAERLRRLVGDNPMVSPRGKLGYRVFLQAITETGDDLIEKALNSHLKAVHEFVVAEVKKAQADHKVSGRFSADLLAWLLIYVGLGYGVMKAMGIEDHGTDTSGTHVQDVIRRLLVGDKGERRP